MKYKRPQVAKAILGKKNNSGNIAMLGFKSLCRAIVIKAAWFWHKIRCRLMEQNAGLSSDISLHSYSRGLFDKDAKNIHWREDNLNNVAGETR